MKSPEVRGYHLEFEPDMRTDLPLPSGPDAEQIQWQRYAKATDVLNGKSSYSELPADMQEREALNTFATIPPLLRIVRSKPN